MITDEQVFHDKKGVLTIDSGWKSEENYSKYKQESSGEGEHQPPCSNPLLITVIYVDARKTIFSL